jgi:hypothetical protein
MEYRRTRRSLWIVRRRTYYYERTHERVLRSGETKIMAEQWEPYDFLAALYN